MRNNMHCGSNVKCNISPPFMEFKCDTLILSTGFKSCRRPQTGRGSGGALTSGFGSEAPCWAGGNAASLGSESQAAERSDCRAEEAVAGTVLRPGAGGAETLCRRLPCQWVPSMSLNLAGPSCWLTCTGSDQNDTSLLLRWGCRILTQF